jgi:hypothetical protein
MFLIQSAILAVLVASTPAEQVLDIGSPGDEAFVGEGFYGREGPVPKSKMPVAARNNFRWARDRFTLRLPMTPSRHNEVTLIGMCRGRLIVSAGSEWRAVVTPGVGAQGETTFVIPATVVGQSRLLEFQFRSDRPMQAGPADKRTLFFLLDKVRIRPVDRLPETIDLDRPVEPPGPASVRDRIRGIEDRPPQGDPVAFAQGLVAQRADVVTLGTMNGQGRVFFPTELAEPHPRIDPSYLPAVLRELRSRGLGVLSWVVFNVQDLRNVEDFAPAKRFPECQMRFIDEPGKTWKPRVGMCLLSSPYVEHHARLLQQAARLDLDGFFFDGFYLGGIPRPSRPGCVCDFCRKAFKKDAGLELPGQVDWTNGTFKRWVRWRNERLLATARYFQQKILAVNPKAKCTFNTNLWPFANKDWETAIPMWRIDDFGVSQHGYSARFSEKWMMLGFKARIGRDMNPAQTDIWRSAALATTCGRGKTDWAWHELEMRTFVLAALSHGITPWHSPIDGPVELARRVFAEAAQREPYFSRQYVADVAVLCSQDTHDFFGHRPGTENLAEFRDGILGTWMLLTENHVPFEFLFDNQISASDLARYRTLVMANTAAVSQADMRTIADWVAGGGTLVTTANTAACDEWGEPLPESRLTTLWGIAPGKTAEKAVGRGRVIHLAGDPGLAWCRNRDAGQGRSLISALRQRRLPLEVQAPNWLVANLFVNPRDPRERWIHLLNVSHLMPGGDSDFRGVGRPEAPRAPAASDADAGTQGISIGGPLREARDVKIRLPGLTIQSARLAVGRQALGLSADGEITVPTLGLHDVVIVRVK